MACRGCGYKTWTKVLISFIIIFCLLQIGLVILNLYLIFENPKQIENNEINQLLQYIEKYEGKSKYLNILSLIFNIIWIVASIVLLKYLSHETERKSLLNSYIIWDVIAILTFILDIVGTILHGLNIKDKEHATGALLMTLISSRFVIFLLYNFITIIAMLVMTTTVHKKLMKPKKRTVPLKPPKPVLKNTKDAYLEEDNVSRVNDWYKHYETPEVQKSPDVLNYIPRINENLKNLDRLSTTSSNTEISHTQTGIPGSYTNVLVNGVPSGTLRRQLPWKYTNELPQKPLRKSPLPSSVMPYVPAPDYADSRPKPHQRRNFEKPGWNQYL